ncbi:response regulator [Janthinobacterium agaricidamnosum]|uniref:Response regulator n=1 Tax=Janthinobacterium agaricidamnosum NBRC 102515 = DSM 9628 TaxID=1349767 RepID=W0V0V7_9BURK|nr:response regulator [Janthinobacterium agaricidamnosum]CDG81255.1 response regulator [Janthinobacterium agaricidamnosum NBRC 102515 = DSM 9628]
MIHLSNERHDAAPLRVLLLDDDIFMLDVLCDMLAEIGAFDIRCESHSELALSTLREHQPDVLICDLSMPDMDGIEFLRAAAETGFRGGVVLLSGMHSAVRMAAERLAQANGLRILGTYKKPLESSDLEAVIKLQLDSGAALAHKDLA